MHSQCSAVQMVLRDFRSSISSDHCWESRLHPIDTEMIGHCMNFFFCHKDFSTETIALVEKFKEIGIESFQVTCHSTIQG